MWLCTHAVNNLYSNVPWPLCIVWDEHARTLPYQEALAPVTGWRLVLTSGALGIPLPII
jgi:hypothetical protein